MKNRNSLAFVTLITITLGTCFILANRNEKKAGNHTSKSEPTVTNRHDTRGGGEEKQKRRERFTELANRMKNLNHEFPTRDGEQFTSEYEIERRKKIDQAFFEMAPELLEKSWQEQPADPQWTQQVIAKTEQVITEQEIDGALLKSADCRGTLCKVSFDLDNRTTFDKLNIQWAVGGPEIGNDIGMLEEKDDGSIELLTYFTKRGDKTTFTELRESIAAKVGNTTSL